MRNLHSLNKQRLVAAVLAGGLIPLATEVDALVTAGTLTALLCGLIAFEAIRFREARARIRRAVHA